VKKRKSNASLKNSTTPEPKRAKRVDSGDDDDEGWTPKGQDWDKFVTEVQTIEKDDRTGKLYAYIAWNGNKKSKIGLDQCYKRLPQSMLKFYEAHL
jgi:chromobox protein 1